MGSSEFNSDTDITRIGKYDVVGVLGRGGMGVVYRAVDRNLNREVAIKTLTEGIKGDSEMLARFYDEGRKTASFKHPNIVTIFELGDDNGIPYIVMELVDGHPLSQLIDSDRPLPLGDRLQIIAELCSALAYAHRSNVIHRDVKPQNIYVQPNGSVKLLDFGIATLEAKRSQDLSLTRPGHVIGTVPYMAPERLRDKPLDRRSDIFAAGVVLFQLVSGELPFNGEEQELIQKILNGPHPALTTKCKGAPAYLDLIVDRSLAKSPNDRYQTADDMSSDLASVIAELRQEQAEELLPEAKRLMDAGDLLQSRAVLQQLLKIQTRQSEAREMLTEIQRRLNERQRGERVQQIRQQADGLFANREFDQCIAILDEGLDLDPNNLELSKLRKNVEKAKERLEKIRGYLRQADSARRDGDYQGAIAAARKVLKVDKTNSKGMMLVDLLTKEAAEAERKREVKLLLQSARGELAARRYKEAILVLNKAELLDSTNPELQLLMGDANAGLAQIRRKEVVTGLENEVLTATSIAELQHVANAVQEALVDMPSESILIQMKAQIDRRIKAQEAREFVEETIQASRNMRPREALDLIQQARRRSPGDERLLSLESLLTERIMQQSVEARRDEILTLAREALDASKFAEAIHYLEVCQLEGIATDEIGELLEYAKSEEVEHRRQDLLRGRIEHAQSLIASSEFDEAIPYLELALCDNDDAAMRLLLEKAVSGREMLRAQIEGVLASVSKLARGGKFQDAIEFLRGQPKPVQRSTRVKSAELAVIDEQQQSIYRTIGRAYGRIATDFSEGANLMRRTQASMGNSLQACYLMEQYQARLRASADRSLEDLISTCKSLIRNRNKLEVTKVVDRGERMLEFASPKTQAGWRSLMQQIEKVGLISSTKS
jgi:serine/threonine-protein kinase